MAVQVEPDLSPESLAGHPRTGLVVLDDNGRVVLFNRAAGMLLEADPEELIGGEIAKGPNQGKIQAWLGSNDGATLLVETTNGALEWSRLSHQEGLRLITIKDIGRRLDLLAKTRQFEAATGSDWKGWNTRSRVLALLQLFRDFCEQPQETASVMEMARLTANVLFPLGGEIALVLKDAAPGNWQWGPANSKSEAATLRTEFSGPVVAFDSGSVAFHGPLDEVMTEAAPLFVQTLEYGIQNLEP